MRKLRTALLGTALLGACLALPVALSGQAKAADPSGPGMVLYNAAGVPVAMLVPLRGAAPAADLRTRDVRADDPMLRMIRDLQSPMPGFPDLSALIAQQDAMLRNTMAEMQAVESQVFAPSGIDRTIEAALRGAPSGQAGTVVVASFSSGRGGTCGETVSYTYPGSSAQPQVSVRRVGDACGTVQPPTSHLVPAALRGALQAAPPALQPRVSQGPHLIRVDYRHPAYARPAPQHG